MPEQYFTAVLPSLPIANTDAAYRE